MVDQPLILKLCLTSTSAIIAECVTYPVDVVKTRLQLQGELTASKVGTKNAAALALQILRKEGLRGIYAGLQPAATRHIFYSGLGSKLLMGLISGATGQLVAVPADLVKVRMQADGRLVAAGLQAEQRYEGMLDALRKIVAQEGVVGLWRGAGPAVQRAALVNLGELATYDQAKQTILSSGLAQEGLPAHTAASICSGFFASVISTPADVVKTRMMNQEPSRPLYRSSLDCLLKSVRAEGLLALYKGFFPTWARLGPWQLTFWVTYEQLRTSTGVGAF